MDLFSRKPELHDQALSELGQMFASPELVTDDSTHSGREDLVHFSPQVMLQKPQADEETFDG